MKTQSSERGYSLVELLLVLAILGILSGVAIPSYLGQRRRARVTGDAQPNARTLAMMLESRKAENGVYGTSGTTQTWKASGTSPSASTSLAPNFSPKGNSQLNYRVVVGGGGLTYTLTVTDPKVSSATVLTATQTGSITLNATYNK